MSILVRILGYWRLVLIAVFLASFTVYSTTRAEAADAVVSGACGEAEFNAALNTVQTSGGGTITFSCGSAPFYIYFSNQKSISTAVTIDGGDLAVLSGQNSTRLFYVGITGILTLKNLTVTSGNGTNTGVPHDGGAVYSDGSLTVDHSKFLNNTTSVSYSGGAVVAYGPLTIRNTSEFANNQAGAGGAVYPRWGSVVNISDSYFHHNTAASISSGWGGALLAWDGPQVTITNTVFDYNTANNNGGALYITANSILALQYSTLTSNTAYDHGGGVYIAGSVGITDTLIAYNQALSLGGGLYNLGTAWLTRTTLDTNYTYSGGGGIYNNTTANLQIQRSIIWNNSASSFAGGISGAGVVTIVNSFLAQNDGGDYGEDIYGTGNVSINFSTILNTKAKAPGTAILNDVSSTLNIKNSIIQASGYDCSGPITSQGFNIGSDGSCDLFQGSDQTFTNPNLGFQISPAGFFLPLPNPGSPALNNGACGGITKDLRDFTRPVGASCDIGALERNPGDPVGHLFLPVMTK